MGLPVVETARLVLREMTADDLDALMAVLGDPVVMRHYPAPFSREKVDSWIEWNLRNYAEFGYGLWAVVLKDSGECIGDCGLTWQLVGYSPDRQLEAGWHIRRDHWNRGLATEAGRACLEYARDVLRQEHLISIIEPDNLPSQAVARKVGMSLEREDVLAGRKRLIFGMSLTPADSVKRTTHMEAAEVIGVLDVLARAGVDSWINGGWGVDALVGRQTRPHEDLDLVIGNDHVEQTIEALQKVGFALDEDTRPIGFTMITPDGRKVDIHPVTWNDDGDGIQAQLNNSTWTYPAQGFHGSGQIAGRQVRCLTPEVQILCHGGYDLDAGDLYDLELLRSILTEHLG